MSIAPSGTLRKIPPPGPRPDEPDGAAAWRRLIVALLLASIGGIGLWSTVVVLPAIQDEFGVSRGGASLTFAMTLVGFAIGGVFMGRLADRFGIVPPLIFGASVLSAGYTLASFAQGYWQFLAAQ